MTKKMTVHSPKNVQTVLGQPQASNLVSGNTALDMQPAIMMGPVPKAFIPKTRVSTTLYLE